MKTTGNDIINRIVDRLEFEEIPCHDSAVIRRLNILTSDEIMQLWSVGNVLEWHNDKIKALGGGEHGS